MKAKVDLLPEIRMFCHLRGPKMYIYVYMASKMVVGSPKYVWRKFRGWLKKFQYHIYIWVPLGYHLQAFLTKGVQKAKNRLKWV